MRERSIRTILFYCLSFTSQFCGRSIGLMRLWMISILYHIVSLQCKNRLLKLKALQQSLCKHPLWSFWSCSYKTNRFRRSRRLKSLWESLFWGFFGCSNNVHAVIACVGWEFPIRIAVVDIRLRRSSTSGKMGHEKQEILNRDFLDHIQITS